MNLGPAEIGLIILAVLLLFGYKKLPDASRSMGRSMRIFKSEMKGMKDDDVAAPHVPASTPVRGEIIAPTVVPTAIDYEAEARAAEAHAAQLRARAAQERSSTSVDGSTR